MDERTVTTIQNAIDALKTLPDDCLGYVENNDHEQPYVWPIVKELISNLETAIATLSNHVVIPEGEFAGIVKSFVQLRENIPVASLSKPERAKQIRAEADDAIAIARKYAPEGNHEVER